ncbi:hypothetical protein J6590_033205, partial [Homalodisca vitripennis]
MVLRPRVGGKGGCTAWAATSHPAPFISTKPGNRISGASSSHCHEHGSAETIEQSQIAENERTWRDVTRGITRLITLNGASTAAGESFTNLPAVFGVVAASGTPSAPASRESWKILQRPSWSHVTSDRAPARYLVLVYVSYVHANAHDYDRVLPQYARTPRVSGHARRYRVVNLGPTHLLTFPIQTHASATLGAHPVRPQLVSLFRLFASESNAYSSGCTLKRPQRWFKRMIKSTFCAHSLVEGLYMSSVQCAFNIITPHPYRHRPNVCAAVSRMTDQSVTSAELIYEPTRADVILVQDRQLVHKSSQRPPPHYSNTLYLDCERKSVVAERDALTSPASRLVTGYSGQPVFCPGTLIARCIVFAFHIQKNRHDYANVRRGGSVIKRAVARSVGEFSVISR